MIRSAVRKFRQLPQKLTGEVAAAASSNKAAQLEWIEKLNEIEEFARKGGSEKAHKLHTSRNKYFSKQK